MKKAKILSKWTLGIFCLVGVLYFTACVKEEGIFNPDGSEAMLSDQSLVGTQVNVDISANGMLRSDTPTRTICGDPTIVKLYAGQHIEIGTVTISNDETNLYVEYSTTGGWVMTDTKLYAGPLANAPTNKPGNPQVGQFPYKTAHDPAVTYFEYVIPLSELGSSFIVAAHADVVLLNEQSVAIQQETAWGDGKRFVKKGNWAMYVEYTKQTCKECEYVLMNFPLVSPTSITVGNIVVTNDAQNLYVTFKAIDPHAFTRTALYAGPLENMPLGTNGIPATKNFPYSTTHLVPVFNYSYTVPLSNLSPCYMIAAYVWTCDNTYGWAFGGDDNSFQKIFGVNFSGWIVPYCTQVCE